MKDIFYCNILNSIFGERAIGPTEFPVSDEGKDAIDQVFNVLTKKQQLVLKLRNEDCLSMEETVKTLGSTKQRVRMIETRALRKIRHPKYSSPLRKYLPEIV